MTRAPNITITSEKRSGTRVNILNITPRDGFSTTEQRDDFIIKKYITQLRSEHKGIFDIRVVARLRETKKV